MNLEFPDYYFSYFSQVPPGNSRIIALPGNRPHTVPSISVSSFLFHAVVLLHVKLLTAEEPNNSTMLLNYFSTLGADVFLTIQCKEASQPAERVPLAELRGSLGAMLSLCFSYTDVFCIPGIFLSRLQHVLL